MADHRRKVEKSGAPDKKLAAVCGLYCGACTLFIATTEDPERLKRLAERFQISEEAAKCYGCRSDKRFPHCESCKMSACAAERGLDFCGECPDYPCDELKVFQTQRPHRIELWDDLERIRDIGYEPWLQKIREHYICFRCQTVNSAYDLKCRVCGAEPSCNYVDQHKQEIEQFLANL